MTAFSIVLDPAHPTLDHHRPGGLPLFGTAMSLGALMTAARSLDPAASIGGIEAVRVRHACILKTARTHRVEVRFDPPGHDERGGYLDGRLVTPARGDAAETLHLEGRLRLGVPEPVRDADPPKPPGEPAVGAGDIYGVFFHGPTFQVVDRVRFGDGATVSKLSTGPDLAALPAPLRLIEFGLQTAGLLELALTGRMMIPHGIAAIAPLPNQTEPEGPVFARARQRPGLDSHSLTDIEVWGGPSLLMRIDGYETVDLPFPSEGGAVRALGARLRGAQANA